MSPRYLFVGFVSAFAAFLYWIFRRDRILILNDLRVGSDVRVLDSGWVEFTRLGAGPTVLILHGALGGYDQGLAIAELLPQDRLQVIPVSRVGYLRSGLSTGQTAENQADSYAMSLDALDIEQVAVIGVSGGGPTAIQFALRHPDGCWGLGLISTITQQPRGLPPFFRTVLAAQDFFKRFDFMGGCFLKLDYRWS